MKIKNKFRFGIGISWFVVFILHMISQEGQAFWIQMTQLVLLGILYIERSLEK